MNGKVFLDTNVLLYSKDRRYPKKQTLAEKTILDGLENGSIAVSVQVLNEFYVNATSKLSPGLSIHEARTVCNSFRVTSPSPLTTETISLAWDVQDRFSLSWWDSLIVAAAMESGCERLFTEDMQHGLVIDGVRIENPFAE